ncbi:MAG: hypothetical protein HYT22_03295 [Candidatus Niyogibacteria bacterium]|nr:hypothetical protein [Candidatus Niyogibacteria bacterium]
MKALLSVVLAVGLLGACLIPLAHAEETVPVAESGEVTFQMNRLESVRDFWARFYGEVLPYRESGEEDLQDSIARCVLAYLKYKAKHLDAVILYAGREPGDATHLICHVFPVDEPTYARMCAGIGMAYVSADESNYTLTCDSKSPTVEVVSEPVETGDAP